VAVFHRYTQQDSIALDLFLEDPAGERSYRNVVLCVDVGAAESLATIVGRTAAALSAQRNPSQGASGLSPQTTNVAVSFGAAGAHNGKPRPDDHSRDLHFRVDRDDAGVVLQDVVYNGRLFRAETVKRLVDSLAFLWEAGTRDPAALIRQLPIMGPADLNKVAFDEASGHAEYPQEPVYATFEAFARAQPEATAATFQGQALSYAELDARANRLAHHLIAQGVGPGVPVAVCVVPSLDILVSMLAVFKAGGTYLPLDPTHPPALIATIIEEAQPRIVLTHAPLSPLTKPEQFPQFFLDTKAGILEGLPPSTPVVAGDGHPLDRAAYQLYTSGTTGKPKGVVASHRNLAHYINVAKQMYGFRSSDIFCSLARYTFSISMFELVSPLCCGGSLRLLARDEVLAPESLAGVLQTVTVVHAGPSLLGNLFRFLRTNPAAAPTFPRMRHASSGGDIVPPSIIEEMKDVFPKAELFVIYGCTEISCMGCTYPIDRAEKVTATYVGKPFPDVSVRLLDPSRNIVPIGVVGEICFSGLGVVSGYFQRPELNAEKFIELDGRRFYTTGDMGRLDASGNLEILGRRDFQVQLRGIRVELAGIENTVRELGLASECIVILKKLDDQDVRLIAYVVSPRHTDIASFRRALAAHLPDYMLPQNLVVLEALPLTANGKVDRRKLQDMPVDLRVTASSGTAPRNAVERKIAGAFARVLNLAEVGIDDDFFDLGGHSLLAVSLLSDLENVLGITLPPSVIFEGATVRLLAEHSQTSFSNVPKPLPLNRGGPGAPLYTLVGVHLYRNLAQRLDGKVAVHAVYAPQEFVMFDSPEKGPSVVDLAREYVEIIRRHRPTGPYRLLGMSFGGIVAFEVAQQLRAAGQEVTFLGLVDAVLPDRSIGGRIEQMRYLMSRPRRAVGKLVAERLKGWFSSRASGGGSEFAEFQKYQDVAKLAPLEDQRQGSYQGATEAYFNRLSRFVGNVTLIVAERRLKQHILQSPALGWARLISPLEIRLVDAEHLALLDEPRVAEVADIVLAGLARSA